MVLHALNGLSSKYDSVAKIIRFTKPFPTFSEMRSMLAMDETRLVNPQITNPTHNNHPSSLSLLHVGTNNSGQSNRGGGSYRSNRGADLTDVVALTTNVAVAQISNNNNTTPLLDSRLALHSTVGFITHHPHHNNHFGPHRHY